VDMPILFSQRFTVLREIFKQPWMRFLSFLWFASGLWDLFLSEWIPEEYGKRLPRVYQVVAMIAGLASWQIWVLTGAVIIVVAAIEYAFRHKRRFSQLQYATSSTEGSANSKENNLRMARRWIKLSDEILADLQIAKPNFVMPPFDPNMSSEVKNRLWPQENRLSQRYLARVAEAKIEMQNAGISISDSILEFPMVNAFSWEEWAAKLGSEGLHVLTEFCERDSD
jgi:hypothetical protein